MAKLQARLPEGDGDGLSAINSELVAKPSKVHVIIGLVDCASLTTDVQTHATTPTVRIRRIEVIDSDVEQAEQLIRRAFERRTGAAVLPLDVEDELTKLFERVADEWGTEDTEDADSTDDEPVCTDCGHPESVHDENGCTLTVDDVGCDCVVGFIIDDGSDDADDDYGSVPEDADDDMPEDES